MSNFDHPRYVRKYLSEYQLDILFETIMISGDVGVKKPDPHIFSLALSATRLRPVEIVYVGDTNEDIEVANASGMFPILIKRQDNCTDINYHDFESDIQNGIIKDINKIRTSCKIISTLKELLYE